MGGFADLFAQRLVEKQLPWDVYGFDGCKKVKGRKRQTLVDSLGLLLEWHAFKEKIVAAAGVQRSPGAGEKEKVLGIRTQEIEIPSAPLRPCSSAILTLYTFQLNLVPFDYC
ncbi:transposase, IS4 (plasmid) [Nostoc sp. NIES-2111]|nr:transposase, IS4 [Nostoc sp. NIES-2111]